MAADITRRKMVTEIARMVLVDLLISIATTIVVVVTMTSTTILFALIAAAIAATTVTATTTWDQRLRLDAMKLPLLVGFSRDCRLVIADVEHHVTMSWWEPWDQRETQRIW
jgi:hypothetical protein